MIIKQIAIDEALELHKRGLMVGVLQPVVPEPKNLDPDIEEDPGWM